MSSGREPNQVIYDRIVDLLESLNGIERECERLNTGEVGDHITQAAICKVFAFSLEEVSYILWQAIGDTPRLDPMDPAYHSEKKDAEMQHRNPNWTIDKAEYTPYEDDHKVLIAVDIEMASVIMSLTSAAQGMVGGVKDTGIHDFADHLRDIIVELEGERKGKEIQNRVNELVGYYKSIGVASLINEILVKEYMDDDEVEITFENVEAMVEEAQSKEAAELLE